MNSIRHFCLTLASLLSLGASAFAVAPAKEGGGQKRPNIIVLLCDDLGYGDVQCLNPERGKIPTPHLAALENDIRRGRSTDGPESSNDIDQIVLWKSDSEKTTRTHPNKP